MQGSIRLITASAVLSAGLVATLAAADGARTHQADKVVTGRPSASEPVVLWVDPPRRPVPVCLAAAWPYVPAECLAASLETAAGSAREPARKVRMIAVEGRSEPGRTSLSQVPEGRTPASIALAQR